MFFIGVTCAGTLSVQCHPTIPRALQLGELPLLLLCHQDLDELLDESWLTQLMLQPSNHQQLQQPAASMAVAVLETGRATATARASAEGGPSSSSMEGSAVAGRSGAVAAGGATARHGGVVINMSTPFSSGASVSVPSAVTAAAAAGSSSTDDEAVAAVTLAAVTDDDDDDGDDGGDDLADCYSSSRRRCGGRDQGDHVAIDIGSSSSSSSRSRKVKAAAAATAAAAAAADGGSSSSSGVRGYCPQVVLLSQGEVTDCLESLVKYLPSLTVVNVSNTQLGPRVSGGPPGGERMGDGNDEAWSG